MRKDRLWEGTLESMSEKVFGPERRQKFEDKITVAETKQDQERQRKIRRLQQTMRSLSRAR